MKNKSNKAAGNQFEREFASILADNHFWLHLFQDNQNGQPCDVSACKNGNTFLFDCKDCRGRYFELSRMEENQYNAMRLFELTGNSRGRLAVRFQGEDICLISYWRVAALLKNGIRRLDREGCIRHGEPFANWLARQKMKDRWGDKYADSDWK